MRRSCALLVLLGLGVAAITAACTSRNAHPPAAAPTAAAIARSPFDTSPPDPVAARGLAGCYALSVGPWSDPRAHGGHIPIPPQVALDTVRQDIRPNALHSFVARTPGFAVPRATRRTPGWSPVGVDSMQIVAWADGTSTLNLFMRRRSTDGELRGTARYFTDGIVVDRTRRWMWETYPSATAAMRPSACAE